MTTPKAPVSAGTQAGIGIGLLFRLMKASAEASVRAESPTEDDLYERAIMERQFENKSQSDKLDRMRSQSRAGMQMVLANRGINPMHVGRSGDIDPYYLAASSRSRVGRVR